MENLLHKIQPDRNSWWPVIISAGVIAVLVSLYWILPDYRYFLQDMWQVLTSGNPSQIENRVSEYGLWGPVIIILLMTAQIFLFVVPSWLLMVIAVLAYGPVSGSVISILAVLIASSVGYWLGVHAGSGLLRKFIGEEKWQGLRRESHRYGIWAIIIARINPFLSNDGVSVVAGVLNLPFTKFIAATLAGIAPLALAIAWFGQEWQQMKTGLLWLSVVSVAGLAVKIRIDKKASREEG